MGDPNRLAQVLRAGLEIKERRGCKEAACAFLIESQPHPVPEATVNTDLEIRPMRHDEMLAVGREIGETVTRGFFVPDALDELSSAPIGTNGMGERSAMDVDSNSELAAAGTGVAQDLAAEGRRLDVPADVRSDESYAGCAPRTACTREGRRTLGNPTIEQAILKRRPGREPRTRQRCCRSFLFAQMSTP